MKRKIECEYYECDKYNYKKLENEKNIKQKQLISEAKTLLVRPNCLLRANCMTELSGTSELSDRHIQMHVPCLLHKNDRTPKIIMPSKPSTGLNPNH